MTQELRGKVEYTAEIHCHLHLIQYHYYIFEQPHQLLLHHHICTHVPRAKLSSLMQIGEIFEKGSYSCHAYILFFSPTIHDIQDKCWIRLVLLSCLPINF